MTHAPRDGAPTDIDSHPSGFNPKALFCGSCIAAVKAIPTSRPLATGHCRAPHFALKPPARHSDDCRFSLRSAARRTVTELEVIIAALRGDHYLLTLPGLPASAGPADSDLMARTHARAPVTTAGARRTRSPRATLLSDLTKLIALIHRYRDDPAAATVFELRLSDGRRLSWREFYYGPERHHELLARVLGTGRRAGPAPVGPVAVSGQVVQRDQEATFTRLKLALREQARAPLHVNVSPTELAADYPSTAGSSCSAPSSHGPPRAGTPRRSAGSTPPT